MGTKRIGLARVEALLENLKREISLGVETTLKDAALSVTAESATHGAGIISTEVAPKTFIHKMGTDIVTVVELDLTGLKKVSDDGDIIGLDGTDGAYFLQYKTATHGVLYRAEISCLELPTGTNVLKDFDIFAGDEADGAYNDDGTSLTNAKTVLTGGGDIALGATKESLATGGVANDQYLYLIEGATSTNAQLFTAGKLVIKLYGRASF